VAFIEDIAHAMGGRAADGALLGGELDYALLSFDDGKILPGGGGALFAARAGALEEVDAATPSEGPSASRNELGTNLRNLVHNLADRWRDGEPGPFTREFAQRAGDYRDLIAFGGTIENLPALEKAFGDLEQIRMRRLARHRRYASKVSSERGTFLPVSDKGMCWRSTLLLRSREDARAITRALRSQKIHASNHYFPLHVIFGGDCPVAEDTGARVLNLWVSDDIDEAAITLAIKTINIGALAHG
jgi:dTDP-4-amino-4,6-dideoxygalactose transaminase